MQMRYQVVYFGVGVVVGGAALHTPSALATSLQFTGDTYTYTGGVGNVVYSETATPRLVPKDEWNLYRGEVEGVEVIPGVLPNSLGKMQSKSVTDRDMSWLFDPVETQKWNGVTFKSYTQYSPWYPLRVGQMPTVVGGWGSAFHHRVEGEVVVPEGYSLLLSLYTEAKGVVSQLAGSALTLLGETSYDGRRHHIYQGLVDSNQGLVGFDIQTGRGTWLENMDAASFFTATAVKKLAPKTPTPPVVTAPTPSPTPTPPGFDENTPPDFEEVFNPGDGDKPPARVPEPGSVLAVLGLGAFVVGVKKRKLA